MPPPAVIVSIIRPISRLLLKESEIASVRTVRGNECSWLIIFLIFINAFSVHPFIKRPAMVEHAVKDDSHAAPVKFFYQLDEQLVAGFQILNIRRSFLILRSKPVLRHAFCQDFSPIFHDHPIMRVYIIIILNIVFVVGRRDKQRIEVQDFHAQILQVIQLIDHSLQIPAIELPHPHLIRIFIPVCYLPAVISYIKILPGLYIIGLVAIIEPVCKNLIHYRPFCPIRRRKSWYNDKFIKCNNFF